MKSTKTILLIASLISSAAQAKFEAHEWGTFTSLVGSNGITQKGMYHEDEPLPDFVHGFGEVQPPVATPPKPPTPPRPPSPCHGKICFGDDTLIQNGITQKMETPVIYFYSDVSRRVNVNVKFPEGVVTDTYPAPIKTFPTMDNHKVLANGDTTFQVDVLPSLVGRIPTVESSNIYSHARNVASNVVKSGNEFEKFIFYRGLGRFQPQFEISSSYGNLNILVDRTESLPQAAFLVHVNEHGHGQLMKLPKMLTLRPVVVGTKALSELRNHSGNAMSFVQSGAEAHQTLVDALVTAGLNTDEAEAMINTWEHGYLKVPGLRLLYILPRAEVDQVLPLTITPAPEKLVRAFVGRIEVMLDTDEQKILNQILSLRNMFDVRTLGRFAEPMLRRVQEVYVAQQAENAQPTDPAVLNLFTNLIDFVAKDGEASSVQ